MSKPPVVSLSAAFLGLLATAATVPSVAAAADDALVAALRKTLAAHPVKGAKVGVHVVDLATGGSVFEHGADVQANPASSVKLVTTAAALDHFGPAHRFHTDVYALPHEGGVLKGDIVLRGAGDPALRAVDLWHLAHLVAAAGYKRVTGGVVVAPGLFDGVHTPPLFDTKDSDHAYRAQICAVAVDLATLLVRVHSPNAVGEHPSVTVDPPGAPVVLDNGATISPGNSKLVVGTIPLSDRDKVVVRGSVPPDHKLRTVRRRTEFPGKVAGAAFSHLLQLEGVELAKPPRFGTGPEGALRVASHESPPLSHIVATLNQWSNNFMAEMLLKGLGAAVGGAPGSAEKGIAAVGRFLARLGVDEEAYTYGNGSGLYDANRFTPRVMTRVLAALWRRSDLWPEYVASLAVGGRPGTLRRRLRKRSVAGRVRAKTGTLSDSVSLSGYARSKSGRDFAFSVLIADVRGIGRARRLADALASRLATWDPTAKGRAAK